MKRQTILFTLACLAAPLPALAASDSAKTSDVKTIKPFKMSCEDFLSVSEAYKPAVVYWIASMDKQGVRENDEILVDEPQVVDRIVDECKKVPKQNLASRVKAWIKDKVVRIEAKI